MEINPKKERNNGEHVIKQKQNEMDNVVGRHKRGVRRYCRWNGRTSVELAGEREEICGRGEEEAQREEEIAEMRRED